MRVFKIRARFNDTLLDGATHQQGDELELEAHRAHDAVHHGLAEYVDPSMQAAFNLLERIRSLPEHDKVVEIADVIAPPAAVAQPEVAPEPEQVEAPAAPSEPAPAAAAKKGPYK